MECIFTCYDDKGEVIYVLNVDCTDQVLSSIIAALKSDVKCVRITIDIAIPQLYIHN